MTRPDKNIDRTRHSQVAPHVGSVSVSLRSVRPVLMYIAAQGHDVNALLRGQGVDPILLRDPEARLPHTAAIRLWEVAGELTNDTNLGLHVRRRSSRVNLEPLNMHCGPAQAWGRLSRACAAIIGSYTTLPKLLSSCIATTRFSVTDCPFLAGHHARFPNSYLSPGC
jgi:hypothetical protein